MLGEEPGVRGGARWYGEDVMLRKRNLRFIETKANRRGSSSLFQEKKFGTNSLTDSIN